jgi:hypothetical protein
MQLDVLSTELDALASASGSLYDDIDERAEVYMLTEDVVGQVC